MKKQQDSGISEKDLLEKLEEEKLHWEQELNKNRETVDAEKVAEVVAMMTGVPVQRIAQAEGTRLLKMSEELKGSVIGQDEAINKIVKVHSTKPGRTEGSEQTHRNLLSSWDLQVLGKPSWPRFWLNISLTV